MVIKRDRVKKAAAALNSKKRNADKAVIFAAVKFVNDKPTETRWVTMSMDVFT
jgi:hypothetical protein